MSKRNWFIGGIAILLFILLAVYFFFPSSEITEDKREKEIKVSFLEVDTQWADSVLKTLSVEEKAAMLIMYQPPSSSLSDSIYLSENFPGAYYLSANNILGKTDKVDDSRSLLLADFDQIPVTDKVKFNVPPESQNTINANPEVFFSVTNDSIRNESISILLKASDFHSLDGVFLPSIGIIGKKSNNWKIYRSDTAAFLKSVSSLGNSLTDHHFLTGSAILNDFFDPEKDKTHSRDSMIKPILAFCKTGFPLFLIDSNFKSDKLEADEISKYLKAEYKFKGLCIARVKKSDLRNENNSMNLLNAGVDLIQTENFHFLRLSLINLINSGKIKKNLVDAKVRKILLAKTWSNMRRKRLGYVPVVSFNVYEQSFPRRIRKAAFTLISNEKNYLPIKNITKNKMAVIHLGHQPPGFTKQLYHYLPKEQSVSSKVIKDVNDHSTLNPSDYKKFNTVIITIFGNISENKSLIDKINLINTQTKLILINFTFPENIPLLTKFPAVIQLWGNTFIESEYSAQAIMGGLKMDARLIYKIPDGKKIRKAKLLSQTRLQYTIPEEVGISSDSLHKIDYIVDEGIRNKAFPAAQVFFAIDGKVFFNRSYGTHTYTDRQEVKTTDLFDMASVTKVAASTIVAMSTYEKGLFKLNDSLYKHLPDTLKKHLRAPSTLRNITFKQILIHATGLAAGQPIIKYIRYRDSLENKQGRFDKFYCDYTDDYYKILVADQFYMEREQEDTIWYAMNRMNVDEIPSYRYSDANMNLLYKLLNAKIKHRWQYYLDSLYYKQLGMFNTFYLPIQNDIEPERIVPTENDRYWRKQLLRGYVHDPTAALFGGVAGNAVLFSTAHDMGILFQMLLFNGSYGGTNYFKKETVDLFTSKQSGTHRGLGFNRQVKGSTYGCSPYASANTFGHTGFTGISVWADKDINLIYVSCTNRVHPDPDNKKIINLGTTKRIHNVIYEQLKYVLPDKINLE